MTNALFSLTAALYGISCVLYLHVLIRGEDNMQRFAHGALTLAIVSHIAFLVAQDTPLSPESLAGIHHVMNLLALGIGQAFLVANFRRNVAALGAFVAPIALMLFLISGLGKDFAPVPHEVETAMLSLHIGTNALGLMAMALAFAAALGYILQEYLLRHRRVGGVFRRLPALDVLDTFGLRAVVTGFPLLTIGMVTGTFWILRAQPGSSGVTWAQGLGLLTWAIFAAVLMMRLTVGWRGKRAAQGTIMGFVCAMFVLLFYALRESGVG